MNAGAMPMLEVRTLEPADKGRWDAFVAACPEATFFHRAGWKDVVERSLGHRCHYLCAVRGDEIRGVLPLVHVRSLLFGSSLISTGFAVYGGIAALDDEARLALDTRAMALADRLGVGHLEYRGFKATHEDWARKDDLYVTFRKALDADPEKNMLAIPRKQRAMVRKGIGNGLTSVLDDDVARLHHLYATSVRNLGTPVFSRRFFQALKDEFADDCQVLVVEGSDGPIAGVMSFFFRDEVLPYYGGGTDAARALAGNDFMYWEVMRRATLRGCRTYDFGRSKRDTGSYLFKKYWGFEPTPLVYEFRLKPGAAIPDVNPLNPKYRLFIAGWKRLPLPLAKALGPLISRGLG